MVVVATREAILPPRPPNLPLSGCDVQQLCFQPGVRRRRQNNKSAFLIECPSCKRCDNTALSFWYRVQAGCRCAAFVSLIVFAFSSLVPRKNIPQQSVSTFTISHNHPVIAQQSGLSDPGRVSLHFFLPVLSKCRFENALFLVSCPL